MALLPWRKAIVVKTEDHTHNTRRFWLEIQETENFLFQPGQFITLNLPIHEKPNKRLRSYSIASWPDGSNVIELIIVHLPGGAGTDYLFGQVQPGSELTFRGPAGVFTLPNNGENDIFFICTGTGVAPFRSMIQHLFREQRGSGQLQLIFGCRTKADLLYESEFRELEKKFARFHYHPTLSRETWDGHHGYVHALYEKLCRTAKPALFYLCGWKQMIDEAKGRISAMGYDKKVIFEELYG